MSSATLDAETFRDYFNRNHTKDASRDTAAILSIEVGWRGMRKREAHEICVAITHAHTHARVHAFMRTTVFTYLAKHFLSFPC